MAARAGDAEVPLGSRLLQVGGTRGQFWGAGVRMNVAQPWRRGEHGSADGLGGPGGESGRSGGQGVE